MRDETSRDQERRESKPGCRPRYKSTLAAQKKTQVATGCFPDADES